MSDDKPGCKPEESAGKIPLKRLVMLVNNDRINEAGQRRIIEKSMPISTLVTKHAWIIAIRMPNGQKVAAYPSSSINPSSPPYFYITDAGAMASVHNKAPIPVAIKKLRVHCDDPELSNAIKFLKRAVMAISA